MFTTSRVINKIHILFVLNCYKTKLLKHVFYDKVQNKSFRLTQWSTTTLLEHNYIKSLLRTSSRVITWNGYLNNHKKVLIKLMLSEQNQSCIWMPHAYIQYPYIQLVVYSKVSTSPTLPASPRAHETCHRPTPLQTCGPIANSDN